MEVVLTLNEEQAKTYNKFKENYENGYLKTNAELNTLLAEAVTEGLAGANSLISKKKQENERDIN